MEKSSVENGLWRLTQSLNYKQNQDFFYGFYHCLSELDEVEKENKLRKITPHHAAKKEHRN